MTSLSQVNEDNVKVRPYISITQAKYLVSLLSPSAEGGDILAKQISYLLRQTLLKYDAGFVVGSYTASPRKTMEEKLGLSSPSSTISQSDEARYMSGSMSEAEAEEFEQAMLKGIGE